MQKSQKCVVKKGKTFIPMLVCRKGKQGILPKITHRSKTGPFHSGGMHGKGGKTARSLKNHARRSQSSFVCICLLQAGASKDACFEAYETIKTIVSIR